MGLQRVMVRLALALASTLLAGFPSRADEMTVVPVTFPSPFLEAASTNATSALDNVLEASAVEPIGDGHRLLVAHDKKVPLRVVETASGRQLGAPLVSAGFPVETPKSSKWEGMATDADGNYYIVGSHSGKTDDEREQHAKLIRFRLKASSETADPVAIDDVSVVSWRLAAPLVQALQHEGLGTKAVDQRKIEGLTIRDLPANQEGHARRELVIGLRQPDDLVRAFAADITTPPSADVELPITRLFAFDAGNREGVRCQLTSMEYLPGWKGFLVVTATEDDQNAFHGNTLWFVPDDCIAHGQGSPIQADKVWVFESAMKAEGLCILPQVTAQADPNTVRLVVTFDNDPHATHIPSRFQVVDLVRKAGSR